MRNGEIGSIPLLAPFYGEWDIYQGFNGEHTHKNEWKHAWDFVMVDSHGRQAREGATKPQDYYCYGKTALAPAIKDVKR